MPPPPSSSASGNPDPVDDILIQPSLNLLLIGTTLSSSLVPIFVALLFFSTRRTRRRPTFILNVLMILLGLTLGAVNGYNQARTLLGLSIAPVFSVAYASLTILVPMLTDWVVVLRVMAIYPPHKLSHRCLSIIYGPMALVKLARMVIDAVFIVQWTRAVVRNAESPFRAGMEAWATPYPKLAWFFQLFDSTYVSAIFLLRLGRGTMDASRLRKYADATGTDASQDQDEGEHSYYRRLQTLFWISTSNFIFPVIFNLAQLILVFRDPSFLDGAYILLVNSYVEILGVLLVTIWASGTGDEQVASANPVLPADEPEAQ
ncbi:hypothetical protein L227DRAFT_181691 [Lentinus tigrinus ALCF2SS1-6]|uniref:G-protein coupled receptors family 1 profile domain-containing protein n=1 Tax=Lentinus tigrinus ALCF2SS1-6 TaxID=1328759 RepID=A0A5C2S4R8_9APHY|nr:hypothetical protein L227DRAFT_181691 [Lentinus tigrinus ALCF2SS1-6]